ncbi:MAG: ABC transporter ATP-binding protein [Clostridia bacterium]|nr:ABC transporter ATP-binding protein [Clostridia bacterium]
MIEFKNVSLAFFEREVLKDFSVTFPEKGIVLITGASGSGKTTITRLILGLTAPDKGEVKTNAAKISVVFQEDRLVPTLSALSNVAIVSDNKEAEKRLSDMELSDSQGLFPDELSGGMKRRVAIARALAFGGDVLLLDEAFNGINEALAKRILEKIAAEYSDRLIIAVTHQPELFSDFEYTEIKI